MKNIAVIILLFTLLTQAFSQRKIDIPKVYTNIEYTKSGDLKYFNPTQNTRTGEIEANPSYTYDKIAIQPTGYENGIRFDFEDKTFNGKIYYGFINHKDGKFRQAIYFKKYAVIQDGEAKIKLSKLKGKYDMIGWEKSKKIHLAYRIQAADGQLVYDGKINIKVGDTFEPTVSIIEGPFVNKVNPTSVTIAFKTNTPTLAEIKIGGKSFKDDKASIKHEIELTDLKSNRNYEYTILYGDWEEKYSVKTAPSPGTRRPFTFAYASDSRAGKGGGERDLFGANNYIMKKMVALSSYKKAAFFQFTGDMISGYSTDISETKLQYSNWKRGIEFFWSHYPVYASMGNHEALLVEFDDWTGVDKFPFETSSAEAVFQQEFCNYENGPETEDGAYYDPNKKEINFPSYKESTYYYTYDNMAMVVLNSNYWYTPSKDKIEIVGGNLHGYIMDKQLDWFAKTMENLEKDENIDHIFVSLHTPLFPNGGHANNDMWYFGDNKWRPYVAGKPVDKGIIERRDELLDIMVNKSKKFICLLAGDEHNYSRMLLTSKSQIYPKDWTGEKLTLNRDSWQIVNGAAGAPYYAQESLPWTSDVKIFSTQYALLLFHVRGGTVSVEVINPDTMEKIEQVVLRDDNIDRRRRGKDSKKESNTERKTIIDLDGDGVEDAPHK